MLALMLMLMVDYTCEGVSQTVNKVAHWHTTEHSPQQRYFLSSGLLSSPLQPSSHPSPRLHSHSLSLSFQSHHKG